jgi:beta-glucosidase
MAYKTEETEWPKMAAEAVGKMTLDEKVNLLSGDGGWKTHGVKRLGIEGVSMHDGPTGLRAATDMTGAGTPKATCFPSACLTACSWDPEVTYMAGAAEGKEALLQDTDIILGPGLNIKRNPLCGRNFEYFSEDPLLAGKMAAGFVKGVQSVGVGACVKHFACNSQEAYRLNDSSEVDERALREIYLRGFEIAIKESDPWMVMASYNRINGVYSCENPKLLKETLRDEWGYRGCVVSDWGAVYHVSVCHGNGLDLEMPCDAKSRKRTLKKALKNGHISEKDIDTCAQNVVGLRFRADKKGQSSRAYNYGMSHEKAKEIALRSFVLLKNERGILPLESYDGSCVVGALAREFRYQGAGSSQVNPVSLASSVDVVQAGRDIDNEVPYEEGYTLSGDPAKDAELAEKAVKTAAESKNVILFMGLPPAYESEGFDRKDMRLPENQISLLQRLKAVNKNIIVVLLCGSPVELPFVGDVKAILLAYLSGEAGASAISDTLLGKSNPSGKLAETWPLKYDDVPNSSFYPGDREVSLYKESIYVGYRYYLTARKKVAFPFGFGLSYTKFEYSNLKYPLRTMLRPESEASVSFTLKNAGDVAGAEVVELYIAPKGGNVYRPAKELKGFQKVYLQPGESKEITFDIDYDFFRYFDPLEKRYEVEAGDYDIQICASSADVKLSKTIKVFGVRKPALRARFPSYYVTPRTSFGAMPNSEFESLMGRKITAPKKRDRFSINSTIEEIGHTLIGKYMLRKLRKMAAESSNGDKRAEESFYEANIKIPLRFMTAGGYPERLVLMIRDLANRKPLKAIHDRLFGARR